MRVRPVPPLGSPGDNPVPADRTRFPTSDPYPEVTEDDQEIREFLYTLVKKEPITAQTAARLTDRTLTEARDHLRVMENWLLVRHTADDKGVIRWRWNPANYWEQEGPPF